MKNDLCRSEASWIEAAEPRGEAAWRNFALMPEAAAPPAAPPDVRTEAVLQGIAELKGAVQTVERLAGAQSRGRTDVP